MAGSLVAASLEGGIPSAAPPASCQQDARASCHHLSQRFLVLKSIPSPYDGPGRYLVCTQIILVTAFLSFYMLLHGARKVCLSLLLEWLGPRTCLTLIPLA